MRLRRVIVNDSDSFLDPSRVLLEPQGLEIVGVARPAAEGMRGGAGWRGPCGESDFAVASRLVEVTECRSAAILISTRYGEDFAELAAESAAPGFIAFSAVGHRDA